MKFTMNSGLLTETITAATSSLPTKPTAPVLGGVLVEAQLGAVVLSSFNYDRSTSRVSLADVSDTDVAVVSGRLLSVVSGNLPKNADVVVSATSTEMEITSGRTTFRLPLIAEDYPALPALDPSDVIGSIDADVFAESIRAIGGFASTETLTESTKMLAALNITTEAGHLVLRATDRYIASRRRVPWSGAKDDVNLSVAAADVLATIKAIGHGAVDQIEILANGGLFGLRTPATTVTTRLMGDEFPNLDRMMNADEHTSAATLPKADLVAMLKRATSIAEDLHTKVDLSLVDGALHVVTSEESVGSIADDIAVVQHGADHKLRLSGKRLLGALAAVDDEHVTLGFNGGTYLVHIYPGQVAPSLDGAMRPPATDTVAMLIGIRSV